MSVQFACSPLLAAPLISVSCGQLTGKDLSSHFEQEERDLQGMIEIFGPMLVGYKMSQQVKI